MCVCHWCASDVINCSCAPNFLVIVHSLLSLLTTVHTASNMQRQNNMIPFVFNEELEISGNTSDSDS